MPPSACEIALPSAAVCVSSFQRACSATSASSAAWLAADSCLSAWLSVSTA
jgi:hypothetical protein